MAKLHSIKFTGPRWLCGLALVALLTSQARGQYDPDWTRNFRVGMLAGFNIKAQFRVANNANFNVSSSRPGATNEHGLDHIFDDGFVRVDKFTNSGGYTTFFSYRSTNQIVGQTLQYQSSSGYTTTSENKNSGNDSPYLGFDLAYGGKLWRGEHLRVGWELGFGLLPIEITDSSTLNANVSTTTYSFDIPNGVHLPAGGYTGPADGYDAPSIFDLANQAGSSSTNTTISGSRTLDVTLYTLRLGPTIFWDASDKFGLSLGAGPAVGFISGSYRYDEIVSGAHNKGSFDASDIVFGGYVNATVTYHADEHGDFYLSAQYMPLGTSTFSKGGREAKLDLSGAIYLSAGINWPF